MSDGQSVSCEKEAGVEGTVRNCKVALATLRTELTRFQDGRYTAGDPTSPGLSMLYQTFAV